MPQKPNQLWIRLLTVVGLVVVLVVVISTWKSPRAKWRSRASRQQVPDVDLTQRDSPMWLEPVSTPAMVSAAETKLKDDAEVIGVTVGKQHRAYSLRALSGVGEQVVNDVVNKVAVTVVYSYRNNFVRVFGDEKADTAFRINVAAWIDRKLHVAYGGQQYALDDAAFPIDDWKFERTTWKEWRTRFPETDVYETPPSFAGPEDSDSAGPTWKTYQTLSDSASLKLSVEYPSGWEVKPLEETGRFKMGPLKPSKKAPFIHITTEKFDSALDAQSYFQKMFSLKAAKKDYANFRVLESVVIELSGYPTRHILFQFSEGVEARVGMVFSIWTKRGGCHLLASGSASAGPIWQSICERVAGSIRLGRDAR